MNTHESAPDYKGFRFPPEIIGYAVWLYFRYSLSFRDVEELLTQRGIVATYETVRQWLTFLRILFVFLSYKFTRGFLQAAWEATSLMNDAVLFLAYLFHVMFGILFLVNDAV